MYAMLFGALGLGFMVNVATPQELADAARFAADDAEVARLMEAAPDEGFADEMVFTNTETGERIVAEVIGFTDAQ
jgi:hypothetical protein